MVIDYKKFCKTVRECVKELDEGGPQVASNVLTKLKQAGAIRNINIRSAPMTDHEILDWYAGQLVDILEDKANFAVNSIINCCDKFAPERLTKE